MAEHGGERWERFRRVRGVPGRDLRRGGRGRDGGEPRGIGSDWGEAQRRVRAPAAAGSCAGAGEEGGKGGVVAFFQGSPPGLS